MAEPTFSDLLQTVLAGASLGRERTRWALGQIMDGAWPESQIAGLLVALAAKGASHEELTGAAEAMRQRATRIETDGAEVLDTCGTGGSGISTFNISTAAALVAAGAGVKVAKHGNRTHSRSSGSADVLAALGVNLDASPAAVSRCLREAGVCFCFAVRCHPAMKHAAPVRKALGVRTIFNLLGPLTNPAGARRQLMGVYDGAVTETIAAVLGALGSIRAMVVHAEDGLDELSTTSPTRVSEFRGGAVTTGTLRPEDFGLERASIKDLLISSAQESAEVVRSVLAGARGPARDIVLLNAAAALAVADRSASIAAGLPLAAESIDSGAARAALEKLIRFSNEERTMKAQSKTGPISRVPRLRRLQPCSASSDNCTAAEKRSRGTQLGNRPITAQDRRLIAAASEVLERCYRRGRHTVGAAVLCPSGRIYTGVNVEACGYGPCAEPIAIGAAFSQGEQAIAAIVAVKKKDGKIVVLSPCGNCRQLVFDYSPDAIVLYSLNGRVHKATASELLPGAYRTKFDEE